MIVLNSFIHPLNANTIRFTSTSVKLVRSNQLTDNQTKLYLHELESKYPNLLSGSSILPEFRHHNFTGLKTILTHLNNQYPHLSKLYSVGKSVEGRDLYVFEISDNPGVREPGKAELKYVGSIHGNEVVGREIMYLYALYLLQNYGKDDRVTRLINNTRIHLMPSMNPDGNEKSILGQCQKEDYGRGNANGIDLNRNFPDQFETLKENRKQEPEVEAVINWSKSIPFVLSVAFHGGSLEAKYPLDLNREHKKGSYGRTPDDSLFRHLALVYSNVSGD
jgi:carboxypeptidase D